MSASLHTCRTYKVEYASVGLYGWDDIKEFIKFLRKKQADGFYGIWISENEEDIEIDFGTLEKLKGEAKWRNVVQNIIDDSDKDNGCARLAIF